MKSILPFLHHGYRMKVSATYAQMYSFITEKIWGNYAKIGENCSGNLTGSRKLPYPGIFWIRAV